MKAQTEAIEHIKSANWARIGRHLGFWVAAGALLYFVIKSDQGSVQFSLVFTLLLMPIVILTSYAYIYWLFPKYLFQGKLLPFAVYGLFLFVVSIYLESMVILWALVKLGDFRFANMTPISTNIAQLGISLYFVVFIITIGYLIRHRVLKKELPTEAKMLQVRADRQNRQVPIDDIVYIESLDDYVTIHLQGEDITTRLGINRLAADLSTDFVRVHRSFLVHKRYVKSFTREKVTVGDAELPISRTYKKAALEQFERSV